MKIRNNSEPPEAGLLPLVRSGVLLLTINYFKEQSNSVTKIDQDKNNTTP